MSELVKNDINKKKDYDGNIKNIEYKIPSITNIANHAP